MNSVRPLRGLTAHVGKGEDRSDGTQTPAYAGDDPERAAGGDRLLGEGPGHRRGRQQLELAEQTCHQSHQPYGGSKGQRREEDDAEGAPRDRRAAASTGAGRSARAGARARRWTRPILLLVGHGRAGHPRVNENGDPHQWQQQRKIRPSLFTRTMGRHRATLANRGLLQQADVTNALDYNEAVPGNEGVPPGKAGLVAHLALLHASPRGEPAGGVAGREVFRQTREMGLFL